MAPAACAHIRSILIPPPDIHGTPTNRAPKGLLCPVPGKLCLLPSGHSTALRLTMLRIVLTESCAPELDMSQSLNRRGHFLTVFREHEHWQAAALMPSLRPERTSSSLLRPRGESGAGQRVSTQLAGVSTSFGGSPARAPVGFPAGDGPAGGVRQAAKGKAARNPELHSARPSPCPAGARGEYG